MLHLLKVVDLEIGKALNSQLGGSKLVAFNRLTQQIILLLYNKYKNLFPPNIFSLIVHVMFKKLKHSKGFCMQQ